MSRRLTNKPPTGPLHVLVRKVVGGEIYERTACGLGVNGRTIPRNRVAATMDRVTCRLCQKSRAMKVWREMNKEDE